MTLPKDDGKFSKGLNIAALIVLILSIIVIVYIGGKYFLPIAVYASPSLVNPYNSESNFQIEYSKTINIEYLEGGQLYDELHAKQWTLNGEADASDPGVQRLISSLNSKIQSDGSSVEISDLNVSYEIQLNGKEKIATIDYKIMLNGKLADIVIFTDSTKSLVDLGWRGMTSTDRIVIDGIEINYPLSVLQAKEPTVYNILKDSEAKLILARNLIDAEEIKNQPIVNWHFLFDPSASGNELDGFDADESIKESALSTHYFGESDRDIEKVFEAEVIADKTYKIQTVEPFRTFNGKLNYLGFVAVDQLDGVDIGGIVAEAPEGFATSDEQGGWTFNPPEKEMSEREKLDEKVRQGLVDNHMTLIVNSDTSWEGYVKDGESWDNQLARGSGSDMFLLSCGDTGIIAVNIQKQTARGFLELQLVQDGRILDQGIVYESMGLVGLGAECIPENTGGCLIATATYGSELAPQVQQLRELRDHKLLQTESGSAFITGFNDLYYSFSPGIADYERENPYFKEAVKLAITPMISSLSILNHVDMDTEAQVLGYGISLILLNVGMYVGVPAVVLFGIKKKI
jgi:hypothetical protein